MRIWSSDGSDDGSVHAMGNGDLVAYGQGPNLIHLYGPPYSSPDVLRLTVEYNGALADAMTRESGTAIWHHRLRTGRGVGIEGRTALEFTEFVAADLPAYVRRFQCYEEGIRWFLCLPPAVQIEASASVPGTWQLILRPGQPIFWYPSTHWSFCWIIPQGNCRIDRTDAGELLVECLPGLSSLVIVGARDYPVGVRNSERVVREGTDSLLESTRSYWEDFTRCRLTKAPELPSLPAQVADALDNVAVLIKAQQSADGGMMAGHMFPLAYVRDQYGTARGMLSLGMTEEARQNLLFRLRKFERFGTLQNAETMGTDCARHVHENDEVEIPAYVILQARDFLLTTGDHNFIRELWPMLEWCWDVQRKHLVGGLLPFNGDETYVAGGFFPRSGLLQGSADSTLAFVEAGRWLARWAATEGSWASTYAERQLSAVAGARAAYRRWFWGGDRLWANAPQRAEWGRPPRFRHGVCEGRCGWFGWTERSATGRYVCPVCMLRKDIPAEVPGRMEVNSVALLPAFLGSDILSPAEIQVVIERVLGQRTESGHIPSVPGTEGCIGYDAGLLLFNLVKLQHPAAESAYDRLLRLLDGAQAWNEYYDADDQVRRGCCRARPWESGINAAAVCYYLSQKG